MSEFLYKELTAAILGAYYKVYNGTSRIYPESFYDRGIVHELAHLGIHCRQQPEWQVYYKDKMVGRQVLDILIANQVVVEDKVTPVLTRLHKAQLLSYLKTVNKSVGLLLNFGSPKPEFQRLAFTPKVAQVTKAQFQQAVTATLSANLVDPELIYAVVGGLFEVHATLGPGFIHRIYANACYHELKLRGLPFKAQKAIQVFYRDISLGELSFNHLRVGESLLVSPVAISNPADLHPEMFCNWLRDQQVPLGLVANFHDVSLMPKFLKPKLA